MMFVCRCGCDIFYEVHPLKISESNFRIWTLKPKLNIDITSVPVLECARCSRQHVPQSTFPGRNILDQEVEFYGELIKMVEARNSNLDFIEKLKSVGIHSHPIGINSYSEPAPEPPPAPQARTVEENSIFKPTKVKDPNKNVKTGKPSK